MKEVAKIKDFSIYEFWFRYRVYYKDQYGEHLEYVFDSLSEAIDYVKGWVE